MAQRCWRGNIALHKSGVSMVLSISAASPSTGLKTSSGLAQSTFRMLLFGLLLSACAKQQVPVQEPKPPVEETPEPVSVDVSHKLEVGVTVANQTCEGSAAEQCNARDDDCDGEIDEGCGYATGSIQVTIAWDTGADIDLYVTDPAGESIFYNKDHRRSASGGHLDHDARGDCRPEQENSRVENAYWENPQPPSGEYLVELHYFGPCGDHGRTSTTLSIAVGGRVLGAFNYELEPEERVRVITFSIP